METQTATGLGEKKFLGHIVPGNVGGKAAKINTFYLHFLDIPVIPDLEEVQEEDLTMQIAAPPRYPSVQTIIIIKKTNSHMIHDLAEKLSSVS